MAGIWPQSRYTPNSSVDSPLYASGWRAGDHSDGQTPASKEGFFLPFQQFTHTHMLQMRRSMEG